VIKILIAPDIPLIKLKDCNPNRNFHPVFFYFLNIVIIGIIK
jgi:hypothetical protein